MTYYLQYGSDIDRYQVCSARKKDFERNWMLVVSCGGGMEDAIRHLMKHNSKQCMLCTC